MHALSDKEGLLGISKWMISILLIIFSFFLLFSCTRNAEEIEDVEEIICTNDKLAGKYFLVQNSAISNDMLQIEIVGNKFESSGIGGFDLWIPSCRFSGILEDCELIIDSYENVEIEGLPSPGGNPRFYYDNLNGSGEFFPEGDSIVLNINFQRTENWEVNFNGILVYQKMK